MAPVYLVLRALIAWGFLALGAGDRFIGQVGLVLFALSELGLLIIIARTIRGAKATGHSPPLYTLFRVVERLPASVSRRPEVHYWEDLTLDVYQAGETPMGPALVYAHPGSWMRGRPGRQARALFHRLTRRGWTVFDIRYPLSPIATFPDHLIGVKRAIAWVRENSGQLGIDRSRIVMSGGSSGAHLAALAALTSNDIDLQPGFEKADTSVAACLPFYGIYDLLVRNPTRYDWPFIAQYVMKAHPSDAPDLYRLGSPVDQVGAGAPPFFVIHGEFDSVVLPAESEHFISALNDAGVPNRYFEVPGAQHGFDAIASLRTRAVADMCVEWLEATVRPTNL